MTGRLHIGTPALVVIHRPRTEDSGEVEYELALDLMEKPGPSPEQRNYAIELLRQDDAWETSVPSALWDQMLNLIYTGNAAAGWELFDRSWPEKKPGKGGFLGAFCDRLSESPYIYDLEYVLKGPPPDCYLSSFGSR
jgi:hypothetical protein